MLRKNILLASISFLPFLGMAQITITSSDMPSVNDTIRYSVVRTATGVDFKSTGANKSWDFTNLKAASQDVYQFKSSTSTPYILSFGFTAIGLKVADSLGSGQMGLKNVYNFFKKSTAKWENVGIGFELSALPLPQAGKHTNTDEIYQFPLNFQDRDSANFALKVPLTAVVVSIGTYFQDGNRINLVDGWGKISTPYKSDIECIRLKSVISETDSIAVQITGQQPINFAFPNNRVEYKWLSKTEKIPILEVSGTELGGTFTPTQIRYRDSYRSTSNPLAPTADFTADKLLASVGAVVTLTDKSTNSPTTFTWTISPGTFQFVNGTNAQSKNPQVSFSANGTYTVKLVAGNMAGTGTVTKSNYITIDDKASVKEMNPAQALVYPNPASQSLTIELKQGNFEMIRVFVFDQDGKKVEGTEFFHENKQIFLNTSRLAPGKYHAILVADQALYQASFTIVR